MLHKWLVVNYTQILFTYGLVFFTLGLAIVLRSRWHSRLSLAHTLPWLAGFGFLHGFNEWGDLFLPIQTQFLSQPAMNVLNSFQLILLAASFACLMQFGVELLRPLPSMWRWLRFIPMVAFVIWLMGPFWLGVTLTHDVELWRLFANALARYLLCVPGGFLAGYALFRQAKIQIQPLQLAPIERMLHIAAGTLIAYGILGGLIVPALPLFPANIVNVDAFTQLFLFPPPVFRSIAGLTLTITIIRALEVFDVEMERTIYHMEERQVIATERERLARDLHDGALQQVYAAGLLAQSLRKQAKGSLSEELDRLILAINQSIEQLRLFLLQMRANLQTIELIPTLEEILEETRRVIPVETHWETSRSLQLTPEQINHLAAFTREALSNAIRHSQTKRIELRLEFIEENLRLFIRDFGRGMPDTPEPGFGLRNMRDRARLLGAELNIESLLGKGTTIYLEMPLAENHAQDSSIDC